MLSNIFMLNTNYAKRAIYTKYFFLLTVTITEIKRIKRLLYIFLQTPHHIMLTTYYEFELTGYKCD